MITDNDLIKKFTSLIYVFRDPMPSFSLERRELEQVVKAPEVKVQGDELVVSSMPNQFEMVMNPRRTRFVDRSDQMPTRGDFTESVARIADILVRTNNIVYKGLGLNFEVNIAPLGDRLAREVISERFINSTNFSSTGYDLVGASVRIWYIARERRHFLYIEPLGNNYSETHYYSHLNIHYDFPDTLPDSEWLSHIISEEYEDFKTVLSRSLLR